MYSVHQALQALLNTKYYLPAECSVLLRTTDRIRIMYTYGLQGAWTGAGKEGRSQPVWSADYSTGY